MINKVLIANRGIIAVRIIQACHELNIKTVAIFSEADRESLHVKLADESYCIGPPEVFGSYLNIEEILKIAVITNVDAIHPGYGFLAENSDFAELCERFNLKFIGPTSQTLQQMGIKDVARTIMNNSGIPITPGSQGTIKDFDEAEKIAEKIGYPVMIKASAGGGGKGMRIASNRDDLKEKLPVTQQEAKISFNNSDIYIEKYIKKFRHIEVQILADSYGDIIHLGERDCSIQRRMQKLIEETPSPIISSENREKIGKLAIQAARAVNYEGAGTIEFIYDYEADLFYFMEMNTRIQVEHGITEMVTGVDLVKEQLRIAAGQKISLTQSQITLNGSSIECRINAEDPYNNFMPTAGEIKKYIEPSGLGVRVDSLAYTSYTVQPFYDSLISKLIVHGANREEAIIKMNRALKHYKIEGIHTTIPFLQETINCERFLEGNYDNNFILESHKTDSTTV